MNTIVQDAINAGLAAQTPVQAVPVAPLGYGVDLLCGSDLDPNMTEVDPLSVLAIGQAIARRWDTPRGTLPNDGRDAGDYGISLRSYLNVGTQARDLRALESRLEIEALKDDRVRKIVCAVTPSGAGVVSLDVRATITPATSDGPFTLTLAVTSADVVIKAIGNAQ